MIDSLDSRALRLTDCYGQRFMKAGTYRYNIVPAGSHCVTEERPFTIRVTEGAPQKKMAQRSVAVRVERGRFRADPEEVSIEAGDLVMWHSSNPRAIPYMVIGDKEFFGSHRLRNESGYSHAFGSAGEYPWKDAYGSGAAGVVRVTNPECKTDLDYQRWHKSLAKGYLVTITDGRAEPREVEILTGQTVFFAITKGPGVSITDERLLDRRDAKPEAVKSSRK